MKILSPQHQQAIAKGMRRAHATKKRREVKPCNS